MERFYCRTCGTLVGIQEVADEENVLHKETMNIEEGRDIWISVGEVSGDMHASYVVRALLEREPSLRIGGMCGDLARSAGMRQDFSYDSIAVMGVFDVVCRLGSITRLLSNVEQAIRLAKPRVIVLIDAPSFNMRVAKLAHSLGIPVIYYILPKVWASRVHRIKALQRYCTKLLCIFPFEVSFLERYGVDIAEYVGNPLVEYTRAVREKNIIPKRQVLLLPGSRTAEVYRLLPLFLAVARMLCAHDPSLTFSCVRAPSMSKELLEQYCNNQVSLYILEPKDRYLAMAESMLAIAASGTATLETALLGLPTIISYKVGFISGLIMRHFIQVSHVGLPNIIANTAIFPEFLQEQATADNLFKASTMLLYDETKRNSIQLALSSLYTELDNGKIDTATLVAEKILAVVA